MPSPSSPPGAKANQDALLMPQVSPDWVWQKGWKKELCRWCAEAKSLRGECKRG